MEYTRLASSKLKPTCDNLIYNRGGSLSMKITKYSMNGEGPTSPFVRLNSHPIPVPILKNQISSELRS